MKKNLKDNVIVKAMKLTPPRGRIAGLLFFPFLNFLYSKPKSKGKWDYLTTQILHFTLPHLPYMPKVVLNFHLYQRVGLSFHLKPNSKGFFFLSLSPNCMHGLKYGK